jgi:hypothetical protein
MGWQLWDSLLIKLLNVCGKLPMLYVPLAYRRRVMQKKLALTNDSRKLCREISVFEDRCMVMKVTTLLRAMDQQIKNLCC